MPKETASEWDTDGDNVGDGWEIRYGFDPCDDSSPNQNDDGDNDGIKDYHEYCLEDSPGSFVDNNVTINYHNMSKWGAQPDRMDIFVEVDWMADEKYAFELIPDWGTYRDYSYLVEYKMSNEAKEKVILAFYKACKYGLNITLHIDDGCMGGGGSLNDYEKDLTITMRTNLYNNMGLNGTVSVSKPGNHGFHDSREGSFHYCIIGNYLKWTDSRGTAMRLGDQFWMAGGRISGTDAWFHVFLHELTHNLLGELDTSHQSECAPSGDAETHCHNSNCAMYESVLRTIKWECS